MNHHEVAELLSKQRFRAQNEYELQQAIATVFERAGVVFKREVSFPIGGRIDFMVGRVGVEVKVDGSAAAVARQLHLYSRRPEVDALILVTSRMQSGRMPDEMSGKPIRVVFLKGAFA